AEDGIRDASGAEDSAKSERVHEVNEKRCSLAKSLRPDHPSIQHRIAPRPCCSPVPGHIPPDSPVVVMVRLRGVELLTLRSNADLARCRCAHAGHRVSRNEIA